MILLKALIWIFGAFLVFIVGRGAFKNDHGELSIRPIPIFLAIAILALTLIGPTCFGEIQSGYRGIVLQFGAPTGKILDEGLYVIMPVMQLVESMSVQIHAYETAAAAASKDLQNVSTKVTLNYAVEPTSVVKVYRDLRHDYLDRIIKPGIQEAVKAATAMYTAEQLITLRPKVRESIQSVLNERLASHGIRIDAMSITSFEFSDSFDTAIEAKVTAEQQALKAERDLVRIQTEAKQKIEGAKAEAEGLRLQRENISAELIELRRIEAYRAAIDKWDGKMPAVVTGNGPVPMLDVFQHASAK